jgi:ferrous iron transport protein B
MGETLTIALAGNPNAGKTTLFNALTGSRQHVGNYPGITVEKKEGFLDFEGASLHIVDLPGTYSLTAYSQEELVARDFLVGERPKVVIDVIDSSVLERNLYLTVQFMELGIPVVLALNMMDEVRKRGIRINSGRLSRLMDLPVVETVSRSGQGKTELVQEAVALAKKGLSWKPLHISYGPDLDETLTQMTARITAKSLLTGRYPARWVALKYLEGDDQIKALGRQADPELADWLEAKCREVADHLRATLGTYPEAVVADYRYGYIAGILRDGVVSSDGLGDRIAVSDKMDRVLTHRFMGPVLMLGVLYLLYWVAFTLGKYPMDWLQSGFDLAAKVVGDGLGEGLLRSLLVDGIIAGVGGVMGFVPLILIIFAFIAFLEDSGYMARIAYMLDRVFRIFGLHGSSVMPFIISGGIAGGCAVPGVLAARTLRSPRERLATLLTAPFMTCGAKLPVFILLAAAFVPKYQAQTMFGLTLLGWAVALGVAWLLRATLVRGESTPFVMELPPYRLPTLRGVAIHTWERTWQYLKKAGTFILAVSILLWAAMTFPGLPADREAAYEAQKAEIGAKIEALTGTTGSKAALAGDAATTGGTKAKDFLDDDAAEPYIFPSTTTAKAAVGEETAESLKAKLEGIDKAKAAETLTSSLAGRLGAALEPVTKWAGFDWRTNIALVGGFAAKEVTISTLGTAYSLGDVDKEDVTPLVERLRVDPNWNVVNGLALMVFILLYTPCIPTLVMIGKETGSWKWPVFSMAFNSTLAYLSAVAIYQVGTFLMH